MMFSAEDFDIGTPAEFLEFLPILIFAAFVSPFLIVAYTIGFISDKVGWLD